MLNIYRASAGSGKTFTLALEFLKLIFKNPENYKRTLAVTFTNKATEEMKRRIIEELYKLATGGDSSYREELLAGSEPKITEELLKAKAKDLLSSILHDYGNFSVSTIDQFFQRVIRSFLRELKQSPSYIVELNEEMVINSAVSNVIRKAHSDMELRNWLTQYIESNIDNKSSLRIEESLQEAGKELLREKVSDIEERIFAYDRKDLENFIKEINERKKQYEEKLTKIAERAFEVIEKYGIEKGELPWNESGTLAPFFKILGRGYIGEKIAQTKKRTFFASIEEMGKRFPNACEGSMEWCKISAKRLKSLNCDSNEIKVAFDSVAKELAKYVDENGKDYATNLVVTENIYQLGVLGAISEEIHNYCREFDVVLLSETTKLLKRLINKNDSTFIYEKIGALYENIMIDEFQDTSKMQWENFSPMILNSVSAGNYSLLVGDIKQSIYKFRNSDWSILAEDVERRFANQGVQNHSLKSNWRSAKNIVEFNNLFFPYAERIVKEKFETQIEPAKLEEEYWKDSISAEYSNAIQEVEKVGVAGCVEIIFTPNGGQEGSEVNGENSDDENSPYVNPEELPKDKGKGAVLQSVKQVLEKLHDKKISYGKCAILVSTKNEGKLVANFLLSENIPFISNESLFVTKSVAVRFIVAILRYLVSPSNPATKGLIASLYATILQNSGASDKECKLFESCNPSDTIAKITHTDFDERELLNRPLFESVEYIIDKFNLGKNKEDVPYITAFQNIVLNFTNRYCDGLYGFIEEWDKNLFESKLSLPESSNAVTIITIHKSKGLEFDHLIIPFFNWDFDKEMGMLWVNRESFSIKDLPVKYGNALLKTHFAAEFSEEHFRFMVDRLNMLYVALTRASLSLHICAEDISDKDKESLREGESISKGKRLYSNYVVRHFLNGTSVEWDECSDTYYRIGELEGVHKATSASEEVGNGKALQSGADLSSGRELKSGESATLPPLDSYDSYLNSERFMIKSSHKEFCEDEESQLEKESKGGADGVSTSGVAGDVEKRRERERSRQEAINEGNLLHFIMQNIRSKDDVRSAVIAAVIKGLAVAECEEEYVATISSYLEQPAVEGWFAKDLKVVRERDIITKEGEIQRPDRVVINDGEVVVIDYKFGGKHPQYTQQVERYCKLLREMGYSQRIRGVIWYPKKQEIEEVALLPAAI